MPAQGEARDNCKLTDRPSGLWCLSHDLPFPHSFITMALGKPVDAGEPILPSWHPLAGMTAEELHARCAHPAYDYATTEGQRKTWDDANVPPADPVTGIIEPGWERNTDRGRDGWDRFEYTEESYWRRLRPGGPVVPRKPLELRLVDLLRRWTDEDYPTSCIDELAAELGVDWETNRG